MILSYYSVQTDLCRGFFMFAHFLFRLPKRSMVIFRGFRVGLAITIWLWKFVLSWINARIQANLEETFLDFYGCLFPFRVNQAKFFHGYKVRTISIVLVMTREKFLGNDFIQQNWMLVIWLLTSSKWIINKLWMRSGIRKKKLVVGAIH